jgi:hypothetical protein
MSANELVNEAACFQCTDPWANWGGAVYLVDQYAETGGPPKDMGQLVIEGDDLVIEGDGIQISI